MIEVNILFLIYKKTLDKIKKLQAEQNDVQPGALIFLLNLL